jgi:hypothetical protein
MKDEVNYEENLHYENLPPRGLSPRSTENLHYEDLPPRGLSPWSTDQVEHPQPDQCPFNFLLSAVVQRAKEETPNPCMGGLLSPPLPTP